MHMRTPAANTVKRSITPSVTTHPALQLVSKCSLPVVGGKAGQQGCPEGAPAILITFAFFSRVVKFRRTGESARSEDDVASGEHDVQIEGVRVGLEAVELDDGAAVPKEFANPTDGKKARRLRH